MSDTRIVIIGGRTFDVPQLPFKIFIDVYPICQKLCEEDVVDGVDQSVDARIKMAMRNGTGIRLSRDEMLDLANAAFLACTAANATLTRDEFDNFAITPWQLCLAFLNIKLQTGAWTVNESAEEEPAPGEGQGANAPQT